MNYIMKSECVINQKDNLKQFRCNCEIVKTFPHISFVIDGYIFELDRNNLFFFDSFQKCFFTMETDTNDVTNDFILGISFYKTNYISFNYENRLSVICGSSIDFSEKIALFEEAVKSNRLDENARGTMDLTNTGKAVYTP